MFAAWDWPSFIVGSVCGLVVMWCAAALSMRGSETDGDTERWR